MPEDQTLNQTVTSEADQKKPSRDHKRTTVRFTDDEFERITEEARVSGFVLSEHG